jgi:hypothetical protein
MVTLFLFLLALLSIQCHNDTIVNPDTYVTPSNLMNIIPLKIGNVWTYRSVAYRIGGSDTSTQVTQIVDTFSLDGKEYFVTNGEPPHLFGFGFTESRETLDSAAYTMYLCRGWYGQLTSSSNGEIQDEWYPFSILKTPLVRGNHWRCADWDSLSGMDFGMVSIVNPDSTVEVQGTTYQHAIYVSLSSNTSGIQFVIVPGIGVVRQTTGILDSYTEKELIEWNIR